jgi:hypothetical protein
LFFSPNSFPHLKQDFSYFFFKTLQINSPFTLELSNIIVEDFDVTLKLEKCSPRFVRTDFAGVTNFKDVSFFYVDCHFAATFELIAANVTVPIFIGRKNSVGFFVSAQISFAFENFPAN